MVSGYNDENFLILIFLNPLFHSILKFIFACTFFCLIATGWAQKSSTPSISIEAAQVGSVASPADAARITKSWADRTKQGIDSMVQQELGVTKEIQSGRERLVKSCEVANSLKQASTKVIPPNISSYEELIDRRLTLRQKNRSDLLASIETLSQKMSKDSASSCGFLGLMSKDPIACEVEKYKKEMVGVFTDGVNRFYDSVFKRYGQYKLVINQATSGCIQVDFLSKLMQADTEYLVPYEERSFVVFTRLIDSVSAAYLNQTSN